MKRLLVIIAVASLVAGLLYPYHGIWLPAQIESATVDGQPVPAERIAALYWDLQRSRFLDEPSKCLGWVELHLRTGAAKQVRLSESLALHNWSSDCP